MSTINFDGPPPVGLSMIRSMMIIMIMVIMLFAEVQHTMKMIFPWRVSTP